MRKNIHAVALGRKGGSANTLAQRRARSENGRKGGRRRQYRIVAGALQKRTGEDWHEIAPPYNRAEREALRRLLVRPLLTRN